MHVCNDRLLQFWNLPGIGTGLLENDTKETALGAAD